MVSVIVPIYNVEKYLKQCLDSLVNQDLKDIEFILIIDGSKDNCEQICKEYLNKDSRFRLIIKENEGYGKTMNLGLKEAKGDYIGIVEPDDYIKPNMFSTLYSKALQYNADVCKSTFTYFYENGKKDEVLLEYNIVDQINKNVLENKGPLLDIKNKYLLLVLYMHGSIWAGIYKKSFLDEKNIRFMETPGAAFQDYPFIIEVLCHNPQCLFINKAFYNYRSYTQNSSTKHKNVFTHLDIFDYLFNQKKVHLNIPVDQREILFHSILRSHIKCNIKRIGIKNVFIFVKKLSTLLKTMVWYIGPSYSHEESYFIRSLKKGGGFKIYYSTYKFMGLSMKKTHIRRFIKLSIKLIDGFLYKLNLFKKIFFR